MRKLDKRNLLSKKYKEWVDELESNNSEHPNDSKLFRYDVVCNLFYLQQGLCAYTEQLLCEAKYYTEENWIGEKFSDEKFEKIEYKGELDHFDPTLKRQKRGWLWENFFMIDADVNSQKVKGSKPVDYILKPDSPDYDPFRLLDYDFSTHRYTANTDLSYEEIIRIENMIQVLGLNYGPVCNLRKMDFGDKSILLQKAQNDFSLIEINEFPTIYEFLKIQFQRNQN